MVYQWKEMNVLVMLDINYINFTAQRMEQYPVLIEEALLDSDRMNKAYQTYPGYFQRSETHLCFNYDWFYNDLLNVDRMKIFNKLMVLVYSNEIHNIVSHAKVKDLSKIVDVFV